MIKEIDELLHAWAKQRAIRESFPGPGNVRCTIGTLIDSQGVVIPATKRSRGLDDPRFPVTELIVNALRHDLNRLVYEHYLRNPLSTPTQKARALGYSGTSAYYRALGTAHEHVRAALVKRRAA
ncbi:hypothetical protein E0E50_03075 [Azotobacter chroococcum subsp. isscasi]|uniref:PA0613 family protein n=1 Tax=Azotobacter chroococcum TaxID=353 RepID=UPI00103FFC7F|nr:hypothetical protein [Azotobacter chroococcum]TBW12642.1 hypothetical protein E0E50_03075 [Azotobacter chroococcum subsp. isscasi]